MNEAPLLRSFIAIPLPQSLQQRIAALQRHLRQLAPKLKTPKVDTLHLTLHFLGDQTQEQLAKIGQIMLSIGKKKKNFNVTLEKVSFFPSQRRPRTLWLAVQPDKKISELHQQLEVHLKKMGLATDQRHYQPHLTIGRFHQKTANIDRLRPFLSHSCGSMKIDRMILYTSELTPQGAIHTARVSAPLTDTEH